MKRYTIDVFEEEPDCWRAELMSGEGFLRLELGTTPGQAVGYLFPEDSQ